MKRYFIFFILILTVTLSHAQVSSSFSNIIKESDKTINILRELSKQNGDMISDEQTILDQANNAPNPQEVIDYVVLRYDNREIKIQRMLADTYLATYEKLSDIASSVAENEGVEKYRDMALFSQKRCEELQKDFTEELRKFVANYGLSEASIANQYFESDKEKVEQEVMMAQSSSSTEVEEGPESYDQKDPYDASDDVYDPWQGSLQLDGAMYRTCETRTYLSLTLNGEGTYKGEIHAFLGDPDEMNPERFDSYDGELHGTVRAKATGNTLLVTIVTATTKAGSNDNFFSHTKYPGTQIFSITYDGSSYSAKATGTFTQFYDGTGDEIGIQVTKN